MQIDLSGKIALVTGASRGIGRAVALQLSSSGAHVILASRSLEALGEVASQIQDQGGKASVCALDVSDPRAVESACAALLAEHQAIDILVNNAGITRDMLVLRMSVDDWESVLGTNLSSAFHLVRHLVYPMTRKRSGRIINISSVTGLRGNAGQANYAAAKAGLIGMTKSLARELASRNITVNAVAPGFIETDMTADLNEQVRAKILPLIPLGRFGQAGDIAAMVTYLASDYAAYITGQTFTVDGGMVM